MEHAGLSTVAEQPFSPPRPGRGGKAAAPNAPFLIGDSEVMQGLRSQLEAVARARRTTLITGPTGVGKELVASALHAASSDGARAAYVAVHCGALPEPLVEAELFGHTRGAFTGAVQARAGLIRSAAGGTLFLDEVDSLVPSVQAKLLRFLESGEYRAVGSDHVERSDVWVIAASNTDLRARVRSGLFREDLLYRLDFLHLDVPALRLRGGDVELLANHFLADVQAGTASPRRLSPAAVDAVYGHAWPGNVRELRHRIERGALLATGDAIEPSDLGLPSVDEDAAAVPRAAPVGAPSATGTPGQAPVRVGTVQDLWTLIERDGLSLAQALEYCERLMIEAALAAEHDNRRRAAQRLGIHVRTIFKKLSR